MYAGWVSLRMRIATTNMLKVKVAIWYGLSQPKTDIAFVNGCRDEMVSRGRSYVGGAPGKPFLASPGSAFYAV